jgi:glycosyltransferase involved in cell wall biosynthesis
MRVGIIAPPWLPIPPPGYGGTEVVVDQLATGIQAAGHDVLLCATADSTCPVPIAATFPRAVGTAGLGSAPELSHVIAGYAAVAEWGADVVHDHTLVGPLYGTRTGIPIVTTNHGPFEGELAEYYRVIAEDVAVVAISRHHASTAGATPIAAVIYHGLDVDAITPGAGGGGFALFLGRMNPCKGVDRAIRMPRPPASLSRSPASCRNRRRRPTSRRPSSRCWEVTSSSWARWARRPNTNCSPMPCACSTPSIGRNRSAW